MKRKVILGYPYSGAFYWLAEKEFQYFGRPRHDKYTEGHPYYKTLYGKHDQSTINNCVSLSLLFDEIYIIGADARLPGIEPEQDKDILTNPDLNLNVFWDWELMNEFKLSEKDLEGHLKDDTIKRILLNLNKKVKQNILQTILIQNYVAERYDCIIIGNKNHIGLSRRMFELHNDIFKRVDIPLLDLENYINGFDRLFNIESLRFSINSFTEFAELRKNKALIDYSNNFSGYLNTAVIGENIDELKFLQGLATIYETNSLKDRISGSLSIGATVVGALSLFAGPLGTAVGVTGLLADSSGRIASSSKNNWIHLAPEINKALTRQRVLKRINELS